jgi:hypothetical protein
MKKIYFLILLCFLSISCVAIPNIVIIGITGMSATGIADTVKGDNDTTVPSFCFPEDVDSDKYTGIGVGANEIKVYSNNEEWRPNNKYLYIFGDVSSNKLLKEIGIKKGDMLYSINGHLTERMSPYEVFSYCGEETVVLYIIDNETGLLKKVNIFQ